MRYHMPAELGCCCSAAPRCGNLRDDAFFVFAHKKSLSAHNQLRTVFFSMKMAETEKIKNWIVWANRKCSSLRASPHTSLHQSRLSRCQLACLAVLQCVFLASSSRMLLLQNWERAKLTAALWGTATATLVGRVGVTVGPGTNPMSTTRGQGPSSIDEIKNILQGRFWQNRVVTECIKCKHFVILGLWYLMKYCKRAHGRSPCTISSP